MTGVDIVAIAAITAAAASAASAGYAISQGGPKVPELPPPLTPPAPPALVPKAAPKALEGETPTQQARRASAKARSAPQASTLLTGVLGAPQSASAVRTTVLGGNK